MFPLSPMFIPHFPLTSFQNMGETIVSTQSFTVPASALVGDLHILVDQAANASGFPTLVTPSGWTIITNAEQGTTVRLTYHFKVLTAADIGQSYAGMNGTSSNFKGQLVYRFNRMLAGAALGMTPADSGFTNADPAAQTIAVSGGTPPTISFGVYRQFGGAAIDPRIFTIGGSDAKQNEHDLGGGTVHYFATRMDPHAQSDISVDMADEGNQNRVFGFYLNLR